MVKERGNLVHIVCTHKCASGAPCASREAQTRRALRCVSCSLHTSHGLQGARMRLAPLRTSGARLTAPLTTLSLTQDKLQGCFVQFIL